MYRCGHCEDLHFAARQARTCWELGESWRPGFESAEARTVVLTWEKKKEYRREQSRTEAEGEFFRLLCEIFPRDRFLMEWWPDGRPYRADCLIERLVVEVDGPSHRGREGYDRYRSAQIRGDGYEVLRVTNHDVLARGDEIVTQIAYRFAAPMVRPESDDRAA